MTKQLVSVDNSAQSVQTGLAILAEMYAGNVSPNGGGREPNGEENSVPLSHYLWIVRRNRWRILAFVAASVLATFLVSQRLTPMYEATTVIDVDRQSPSALIGQDSTRPMANDSDQFIATQMKLVASDAVLRPVADKYKLLELEHQFKSPTEEGRQLAGNAPILLKQIRVSRPPNTYLLLVNYRSPNPQLSADVTNAVAQSFLQHTYEIRYNSSASVSTYMERQIEELKAKMERSGAALAQFERELNVINPEDKTSILSARLLQLNTDFTNAQGDRMKKQAAFDSVRSGSMEAGQVSQQGEALRRLSERLSDAEEKYAEISTRFAANHPENRKSAAQIAEIKQSIEAMREKITQRSQVEYSEAMNREQLVQSTMKQAKSEFDRLNARSFEYQAAKREAEADKKLYEELVRKIKEATINTSFQNSSIRIADLARPAFKAVFPNIPLNLGIAFLCSLLIAIAVAVTADVLDNTVRDPEQITRGMNTVVLGSLPSVRNWRNQIVGDSKSVVPALTATTQRQSEFQEAVRTLRNSILLADFDRKLKSLLITSSSASEGKSTSASHLAIAHAEQRRKTLLIDGDLRRPSLHKRFGISGQKGLVNVLEGESGWRGLVHKLDGYPDLDLLPAGPPSTCAPELIGRGIGQILEECTAEYDLVIVDGPPAIGFAEPLTMATAVDGVIVVARAGQTQQKAVGSLLGTLKRLRVNVVGVVLNQVNRDVTNSYYYQAGYAGYYNRAQQTES